MDFDNIIDGDPEKLGLGVKFLSCFLFKIPVFLPVRQEARKKLDENIKTVLDLIEAEYRNELQLKKLAQIRGHGT